MPLPTNILYPVDFSDRSRLVWPDVIRMARLLNAPVTLLHALAPDAERQGETQVREQLERFVAEAEGLTVRGEVEYGSAAECIVGRVASMDSPLIMIPTRGHTRFRQLLLGSVTAAVLHDADCPVWTDAHVDQEPAGGAGYGSIVCAIDMGPRSGAVLRAACEFAARSSAELHVVHSVQRIDPRFTSPVAERAHRFLMGQAQEDFVVHCAEAGADAELEIVEDVGTVEGILDAIRRHEADLLVIGRGVIQGPLGRLRTNAHELIRRSPRPVLSI